MSCGRVPGAVLALFLAAWAAFPAAAAESRPHSAKSTVRKVNHRTSGKRSRTTSPVHRKRKAAATRAFRPAVVPRGFTARAAIVYDNQSGEVLWQRNADEPLPPASTTKVISAAVALRSGQLEESIEVSPQAAAQPSSKIGLRAGWRMRLRDLIYAMLLNSANDASVVVAEGVAGSVPAFADRMNAQARRFGATHSHFENPNGLPDDNHVSTARDLAMVFSNALRIPLFEEILSTSSQPVWLTEGRDSPFILHTHNRLLENYEFRVIGKTGWTQAAGKCFVGAARSDGRDVIVAVLGSRNLWGDVRKLVEFGMRGGLPPDVEVASLSPVERAPAHAAIGDDEEESAPALPSPYRGRTANPSVKAESTPPGNPAGQHVAKKQPAPLRRLVERSARGANPSPRSTQHTAVAAKASKQPAVTAKNPSNRRPTGPQVASHGAQERRRWGVQRTPAAAKAGPRPPSKKTNGRVAAPVTIARSKGAAPASKKPAVPSQVPGRTSGGTGRSKSAS